MNDSNIHKLRQECHKGDNGFRIEYVRQHTLMKHTLLIMWCVVIAQERIFLDQCFDAQVQKVRCPEILDGKIRNPGRLDDRRQAECSEERMDE